MRKYLLPEQGNFYRANLHCHTTVSDGGLTPQQVKELYQKNGYSIIAFTDHDIMIPHPELRDETFLPLIGYEMEVNEAECSTNVFGEKKCCHICLIALDDTDPRQVCWHRTGYLFGHAPEYREQARFDPALPDYHRVYSPEGVSDMMQKGRAGGFFVTWNHPSWSMEEYPDYIGYTGMHAMEICNYGCVEAGYEDYVPQIYDTMLRAGKQIYCIAADDNHGIHDNFGGFTMIKAPALEYRAVTQALLDGHFYASQGPAIEALYLEGNTVHIECSAAREILLNTGLRRAKSVRQKDGAPLTHASFEILPEYGYFRLTVVDANGKHANTTAYFTKDWL